MRSGYQTLLEPDTKSRSSKPVVAHAGYFDGYGGTTFYPSLETGPVGKEFIIYYWNGDWRGDYSYVFATQDATVQIFNPAGDLVDQKALARGQYWMLSIPNGVYHIRSTGRIAIETIAEYGHTTVPSVDSNAVGYQFYFATHYLHSGAFVVFAYQDTQIRVYDLRTGVLRFSRFLQRGEYWWQSGLQTEPFRLDSSGLVEVWAGSTWGGTSIMNFEEYSQSTTVGKAGKEFYLHMLGGGSVLYGLFDGTVVDIDGSKIDLDRDDYYEIPGCCALLHIQANHPILIGTTGDPGGYYNISTYLGGGGWESSSMPPWLHINHLSGTITEKGAIDIQVVFDATGLPEGIYRTVLYLSTNDPLNPVVAIPVRMEVGSWPFHRYLPYQRK